MREDNRTAAASAGGRGARPAAPSWRSPSLYVRAAIVIACAAGLLYHLVGIPGTDAFGVPYLIDADVYRNGAQLWISGADLYGPMPPTHAGTALPFTYPPLAAVLFSPLAYMPLAATAIVITLATFVALAGTCAIWIGALRPVLPRFPAGLRPVAWAAATAVAAGIWLEPLFNTLGYGQINAILMLLVAADLLVPRTFWPRGSLLGFAAAVKLTPAAFILYFLLRRDMRSTLRAGVSFLLWTGIGALAAPADSKTYWLSVLLDTGRIGDLGYTANQSISGVLARAGLSGGAHTAVWLALAVGTVALGAAAMIRAFTAGRPATALGVNALTGLLVSPVSWSHHWVWVLPILLALVAFARREGPAACAVLAGAGVIVFAVGPQWFAATATGHQSTWPVWAQIVGSAYVWWAFAVIVTVLVAERPRRSVRPGPIYPASPPPIRRSTDPGPRAAAPPARAD